MREYKNWLRDKIREMELEETNARNRMADMSIENKDFLKTHADIIAFGSSRVALQEAYDELNMMVD